MNKETQLQETAQPRRRFTDDSERLDTVIGPETRFKGNLETASSIELQGMIEGDCAIGGFLRLHRGGSITGGITVEAAVLEGEVRGNIRAKGHVELRSGSSLRGNIHAGSLAIAEGAFFQGEVKMTGPDARPPITFQEKREPGPESQ